MKKLTKITALALLSCSALSVQAATQSLTINYTLTVPTACKFLNSSTTFNQTIPLDGSSTNFDISIKCNVPYQLSVEALNQTELNQSELINTTIGSTAAIPYSLELRFPSTRPPVPFHVNGPALGPLYPTPLTQTDTFQLQAKTLSAVTSENFAQGNYTDTVTILLSY